MEIRRAPEVWPFGRVSTERARMAASWIMGSEVVREEMIVGASCVDVVEGLGEREGEELGDGGEIGEVEDVGSLERRTGVVVVFGTL